MGGCQRVGSVGGQMENINTMRGPFSVLLLLVQKASFNIVSGTIGLLAGSSGQLIKRDASGNEETIPGMLRKTTTGDPTTGLYNGLIVVNTVDKTVKIYEDGTWVTLTDNWS